ncbi:MAG TPA: hypothetical protein VN830_06065 [Verrucomicrobiae bacterium]|nr:hypothetical protein [Verrucomicrobiae bacterium]
MTFTYGVIADCGIVLVADSQVTDTHSDRFGVIGTYESCRGKITRVGIRFAFSVAGNGGLADTLLAKVDRGRIDKLSSFEEVVQNYEWSMRQEFQRLYSSGAPRDLEAVFLFCGYNVVGSPQIVKLDSANFFTQNPVTGRDMAATGEARHGAAYYLHHRFYRERIPLEQAKLLAYCVAKEVADQDNSVGGPIEMEVITLKGSRPLMDTEREKYEKAHREITSQVHSFLTEFH